MRRVLDINSNSTRFVTDTQRLSDSEVVIFENFKDSLLNEGNYYQSRMSTIDQLAYDKKMVWGREHTQGVVDNLMGLSKKHFKTGEIRVEGPDLDTLCEAYSNQTQIISRIQSYPNDLVDYMKQIFTQMSDMDYSVFMDVVNVWKELVFFTLQPVFISVLGIVNYITHERYLMSGNNLVQLFEFAKHQLTQPLIFQWIDKLPSLTNFTFPTKSILVVSTIVAIPLLYLCYTVAFPTGSPMLEDAQTESKDQIVVKVPKLKKPPSIFPKEMRAWVHQVGSELGSLFGELTSGIGLGYVGTAQENITTRIEESIENSDTTVTLDRNAKTVSVAKKEG